MDLTFNIIFVPGTVRYLRLAILSLLRCSNYRYRLVANGLERAEHSLLRNFSEISDRLEFYAYPTATPLPHGILLTLLQSRERGDHFCFMDPDIFASGPFEEELESHLQDCDIFSSCAPLGLDPDKLPIGLRGPCLQAPNGMALATTFFCVYRNEPLRHLIAETGTSFERYNCSWIFPEHLRDPLLQIGLPSVDYCDTGKLLNLLAHSHNLRFEYHAVSALMHVGGMGYYLMKNCRRKWWKRRIDHYLRRPFVLRDEDLAATTGGMPKRWANTMIGRSASTAGAAGARRRRNPLRCGIAQFFAEYLQYLLDGAPRPILASSDQLLSHRIDRLCSILSETFAEHRASIAA